MNRKKFLLITSLVALLIGFFALIFPNLLLTQAKMALPSEAANVMARTTGVLLITVGVLNFLIRNDEDSPTIRSILIADLILQLSLLPIDPLAYKAGIFHTWSSFLPNTILHLILAGGFAYYLVQINKNLNRSIKLR